jgi:hypothetical protein
MSPHGGKNSGRIRCDWINQETDYTGSSVESVVIPKGQAQLAGYLRTHRVVDRCLECDRPMTWLQRLKRVFAIDIEICPD